MGNAKSPSLRSISHISLSPSLPRSICHISLSPNFRLNNNNSPTLRTLNINHSNSNKVILNNIHPEFDWNNSGIQRSHSVSSTISNKSTISLDSDDEEENIKDL